MPDDKDSHSSAPSSSSARTDDGKVKAEDTNETSPETEIVTALGPRDVLMGRGAPVSEYEGNKLLRSVAIARQAEYVRSRNREDKQRVAMDMIRAVQADGGRFLRKAENRGGGDGETHWQVVKNTRDIVGKVKQLLRDMGPDAIRKRADRRRNRPRVGQRGGGKGGTARPQAYPTTRDNVAATAKTSEQSGESRVTPARLQSVGGADFGGRGLPAQSSLASLLTMPFQQQQQLPSSPQATLADLDRIRAALNPGISGHRLAPLRQQQQQQQPNAPHTPLLLAQLLSQQQPPPPRQQVHYNNSMAEAIRSLSLRQQQQQQHAPPSHSLSDPVTRLLLQHEQQQRDPGTATSVREQALVESLARLQRSAQTVDILQQQQQRQRRRQQQQQLLADLLVARREEQRDSLDEFGR